MNILVLEDEKSILDMMKSALEGHQVRLSTNAVDAYATFLTEEFDLLIVDIRLPEIDGLFFAERVVHLGKKTPIIIMTGLDTTDSTLLAKLNKIPNIRRIYQKPISTHDLCRYVTEVFENTASSNWNGFGILKC